MATFQGISALEDTFSTAKSFDTPLREKSIIVTKEGYYPKQTSVFVGERVRFFVTSTTDNNECFILRDKSLFLAAEKGKVSEGEVLFTKPGTHEYYCPTGQLKGRLTVLERPKEVHERSIASEEEQRPRYKTWMPRDE